MNRFSLNTNNYELLDNIGNSSFSELYTVKEKNTGEVFVAKISLKSCDNSDPLIGALINNISKISQISHPSILQYIGYSPINFHNEDKPIIISQFMPNNSLDEILSKNITSNCWNETKKIINLYGISSAMSYLHSHEIIHGYLYPTNILLDSHLFPKIADFQPLNLHDSRQNTINTKTAIYIAPELCANSSHSKSGDIYAFGMIMYEILTNEKPFKNLNFLEIYTKITSGNRPDIPSSINDSYKNLINRCWSQNPDDRPSFDEITNLLRKNDFFLTDSIDRNEYENFINNIDEYQKVYDESHKCITYEDFISNNENTQNQEKLNQGDSKSEPPSPSCLFEPDKQNNFDKMSETDTIKKKNNLFDSNEGLSEKPIHIFEDSNQAEHIDLLESLNQNKQTFSFKPPKQNKPVYLAEPPCKSKHPSFFEENQDEGKQKVNNLFGENINKQTKSNSLFDENINESNKSSNLSGDSLCKQTKSSNLFGGYTDSNNNTIDLFNSPKQNKHASQLDDDQFNMPELAKQTNTDNSSQSTNDLQQTLDSFENQTQYENIDIPKSPYQEFGMNFPESPYQNIDFDVTDLSFQNIGSELPESRQQIDLLESDEKNKQSHAYNPKKANDKIGFHPVSPLDYVNKYSNHHVIPEFDISLSSFLDLYPRICTKKQKTEALPYIRSSIEAESTEGMNAYGALLYNGELVDQNKKEAARFFKMSFEKGNLDGMYNYACVLFNGEGVASNRSMAINYLRTLAEEKEHSYGMNKYGVLLLDGKGVPTDKQKAIHYIKTAAHKGCPDAMFTYGVCLFHGDVIPMNKSEAYKYFLKASDCGHIDSFMFCGLYLFNGYGGIPINKKAAASCMKVAADNENPFAMYCYALMIADSIKTFSFISDHEQVQHIIRESIWYTKMAADNGIVKAMDLYARFLAKGDFVQRDLRKALYYYKLAADKGGDKEMYKYASILFNGKITPVNKKEAAKYYKMAADKGNISAMNEYATMLRLGDGIQPDKNEAAKYYKLAAEKGNVQAMNFYGLMSINNEIQCDKKEAFQYINKAASAGHEKAIYNLGVAFYRGHGIEQNKEEAIKLFKKAADKGVKEAIDSLKSLGIKNDSSCLIF